MSHRMTLTGACLALALSTGVAPAQTTSTWTGGGGDNNWATALNWDTAPPSGGADTLTVILAGTTRTATVQNLGSTFKLNQLVLDGSATAGFSVSGATLAFTGSNPLLTYNGTLNQPSGLRINSPVDLGSGTTFGLNIDSLGGSGAYAEMVLSGLLSGTNVTINKGGANSFGELVITSRNNSFTGTFNNNQGTTYLVGVNALGRTAVVNTGSSALVGVQAGTTAFTSQGMTEGGSSQQLGNLTGSGFLQIGTPNFAAAVFVGSVNANSTFAGAINASNSGSLFAKVGTGTLTYTGSSSAYNAATWVQGGTLLLQGTSGKLNGATTGSVTVSGGATFRLNNGSGNNNNRLTDSAPVVLAGGTFQLDGNASANTAEFVGALTLGAGQSTIAANPNAAQPTALTFASASPGTAGGTVLFRGAGLGGALAAGAANVTFSTNPSLVGGGGAAGSTTLSILPWAVASSTNGTTPDTFVTIGANGVRPLALATEYATNLTTAAATDNVRDASDRTVSTASAVNSLVTTGANQTVTLNQSLTLTSGAMLSTGAGAQLTGAGGLKFGANGAGTAYVTAAADFTLATPVTAASFSKSGPGILAVKSAVGLGNNGLVAVNTGTLAVQSGGSFAASGGTLAYQVSAGATLDASAVSGLTLSTNQQLGGNGTVVGQVTVGNGGVIQPSGLPGPGTLNVGNMIWQPGGTYRWSASSVLTDANGGSPYAVSKILSTTGSLDLTGLSSANRFTIQVTTLNPDGTAGPLYDLDPTGSYSWTIASFAGGISGFSASAFNLAPGYSISAQGNNLVLTLSPVPEPATTLAIGAAGLAVAGWVNRRRRAKSVPAA
jgi:hypothetical protein